MLATFSKDMGVRLAHHTARSLFYQEMSNGFEAEPMKKIHAWRKYHMDELFGVKRVLFAAAYHVFLTLKRLLRVMILRFNVTRLRHQKAIKIKALIQRFIQGLKMRISQHGPRMEQRTCRHL